MRQKTAVTIEHSEIAEVTMDEAKAAVEAYLKIVFKKKRQVFPSDVADALGLKYDTVREVFDF
jgi:hypothetical protein